MAESPDFEGILRSLVDWNVRFVLIGGLAMIAQGSANLTTDIDSFTPAILKTSNVLFGPYEESIPDCELRENRFREHRSGT